MDKIHLENEQNLRENMNLKSEIMDLKEEIKDLKLQCDEMNSNLLNNHRLLSNYQSYFNQQEERSLSYSKDRTLEQGEEYGLAREENTTGIFFF